MSINDKFEEWAESYALYCEPLTKESRDADCMAAYKAATAQSQQELARQALRISELEKALKTIVIGDYRKVFETTIYNNARNLLSTTTTTTHLDDYVMSRLEAVCYIHPMFINQSVCTLGAEVAFFKPNDNSVQLYSLKESDK